MLPSELEEEMDMKHEKFLRQYPLDTEQQRFFQVRSNLLIVVF